MFGSAACASVAAATWSAVSQLMLPAVCRNVPGGLLPEVIDVLDVEPAFLLHEGAGIQLRIARKRLHDFRNLIGIDPTERKPPDED